MHTLEILFMKKKFKEKMLIPSQAMNLLNQWYLLEFILKIQKIMKNSRNLFKNYALQMEVFILTMNQVLHWGVVSDAVF